MKHHAPKSAFQRNTLFEASPPLFKARTDKLEQDAPAIVYADPIRPTTPTETLQGLLWASNEAPCPKKCFSAKHTF